MLNNEVLSDGKAGKPAGKEVGINKVRRAILAISFLLLLLVSAGCGKVFFYSFEKEQSLSDGTYTWSIYGIGNYAFKTHGIVLDNKTAVCPLWFNGDVKG